MTSLPKVGAECRATRSNALVLDPDGFEGCALDYIRSIITGPRGGPRDSAARAVR